MNELILAKRMMCFIDNDDPDIFNINLGIYILHFASSEPEM